MHEQEQYQGELLLWKRRILEFREKYKETPAGYGESVIKKEEAFSALENEEKLWKSQKEKRLLKYCSYEKQTFVGRENLLADIQKAFVSGDSPVFLYGIGGIGKTALAQEYARCQNTLYDHILFITCGEGIGQAITDDAQILIQGMTYKQERYGSRQRYLKEKCIALEQLAKRERILLILDDCNNMNPKEVQMVFRIPCHILVTTRLDTEELGRIYPGQNIYVGELEKQEEWEAFIQAYQTRKLTLKEEKWIWNLKKKMCGHTLSVMLAIRKVEEGMKEYENDMPEMILSGYPMNMSDKKALCYLATMPVQGVEEEVFYQLTDLNKKSMKRLEKYMLIRRTRIYSEENTFFLSMHPMIAQAVIQQWHPTAFECRKLFERTKQYLWDAWDKTFEENEKCIPMAFSMLRSFEPDARLATAFGKLIALLWIQGYFDEAEQFSLKLYDTVEEYYGKNHTMSGEMALWTAAVYHNQMKFEQAWEWYKKGADILLSVQEDTSQLLYQQSEALFKLARAYRYLGKTDMAYENIQEAERKGRELLRRNVVKEEDISSEARLCYIGLEKAKILLAMGKIEQAEVIFYQSLDKIQEVYTDGYRINEFLYFQITLLMKRGQFEKAGRIANQAYSQAVRYRGEDNKEILKCREKQADICMERMEYKQAVLYYKEVYQRLFDFYPFQENWKSQIKEKIKNCDHARYKDDR